MHGEKVEDGHGPTLVRIWGCNRLRGESGLRGGMSQSQVRVWFFGGTTESEQDYLTFMCLKYWTKCTVGPFHQCFPWKSVQSCHLGCKEHIFAYISLGSVINSNVGGNGGSERQDYKTRRRKTENMMP